MWAKRPNLVQRKEFNMVCALHFYFYYLNFGKTMPKIGM